MHNRKTVSLPVTGGSSLLVIFAVLCLTVFALLGLSTVQADSRLSDATAQAVKRYYEADCQAEEIFARLRCGEVVNTVSVSGSIYTYECPISDTQILQVELLKEADTWTVQRWHVVSAVQWESDESLSVWDGFSIP